MTALTQEQKMHYTLRIAAAMCFIGHGAFGIITKPIWCNYFAVFGIGHDTAYQMMPLVGSIDIILGIGMLIYPIRAMAGWLVVWGIVTGTLRPLSGEPFAELIERAGNYGAPLALLILAGKPYNFRSWFTRIQPSVSVDAKTLANVRLCLRIVVFLLLLGHGWLNVIEKKGLISQYTALGFSHPANVALTAGILEIAAACLILIRPVGPFLMAILVWKMGTELFYPHWEIFEWIERGGSYGTILALWLSLPQMRGALSGTSLHRSSQCNTEQTS
jgi:hypothetical protein